MVYDNFSRLTYIYNSKSKRKRVRFCFTEYDVILRYGTSNVRLLTMVHLMQTILRSIDIS